MTNWSENHGFEERTPFLFFVGERKIMNHFRGAVSVSFGCDFTTLGSLWIIGFSLGENFFHSFDDVRRLHDDFFGDRF
jgi:hypothetical protein